MENIPALDGLATIALGAEELPYLKTGLSHIKGPFIRLTFEYHRKRANPFETYVPGDREASTLLTTPTTSSKFTELNHNLNPMSIPRLQNFKTPTGFPTIAQGREERATLGTRPRRERSLSPSEGERARERGLSFPTTLDHSTAPMQTAVRHANRGIPENPVTNKTSQELNAPRPLSLSIDFLRYELNGSASSEAR